MSSSAAVKNALGAKVSWKAWELRRSAGPCAFQMKTAVVVTVNLGLSICSDAAVSGDPLGSECLPERPSCAGLCVSAGSISFCSQRCVLGENSQCGTDGYCGLLGKKESSRGDVGYCQQVCDCNTQCRHPNALCVVDETVQEASARAGVCVASPAEGTPSIEHCPNAAPIGDAGSP
jgi:hypothetical protein